METIEALLGNTFAGIAESLAHLWNFLLLGAHAFGWPTMILSLFGGVLLFLLIGAVVEGVLWVVKALAVAAFMRLKS